MMFFRRPKKNTDVKSRRHACSLTDASGTPVKESPFLQSLREQTPADVPLSCEPEKRSRTKNAGNVVRYFLVFICICVCVGSCVYLIDNHRQKMEAETLYGEAADEFEAAGLDFGFGTAGTPSDKKGDGLHLLADKAQTALPALSVTLQHMGSSDLPGETGGSPYEEELAKLRALLRNYKDRNGDVFGYISIPAVNIGYVTVQGDDNDFYLNHNYKREPLVVGSIYMDYRCSENLMENYNTVLYGHNIVSTGIMFNGVTDFFDRNIFENELIYLYTMDGVYVYKPFAIYDTRPDSGYIRTDFETPEEYTEFLANMKSRSRISSDVTLDAEDHILTLSTCTNYNDGRYALHAYLVEYIH